MVHPFAPQCAISVGLGPGRAPLGRNWSKWLEWAKAHRQPPEIAKHEDVASAHRLPAELEGLRGSLFDSRLPAESGIWGLWLPAF